MPDGPPPPEIEETYEVVEELTPDERWDVPEALTPDDDVPEVSVGPKDNKRIHTRQKEVIDEIYDNFDSSSAT